MYRLMGALALTAVLAGCGDSGTAASPSDRVVKITMLDNRFVPSVIEVPRGKAVTFRFVNQGKLRHEAVLGDESVQNAHASAMKDGKAMTSTDMSDMNKSSQTKKLTVEPQKSGEFTTTFDMAGKTLLGCHQPGHYESGMKATVRIT